MSKPNYVWVNPVTNDILIKNKLIKIKDKLRKKLKERKDNGQQSKLQ